MTVQTTRRSFVAAIPAAAVAVAVPASAISAPGIPADRRAWDAAMRLYTEAKAEDDAHDPIYQRVLVKWRAGRPSMDAIHWREFSFRNRDHVARVLDLEKEWTAFLASEGKLWGASDSEAYKARFRAALDSVQAFRDAEAAHNRDSGMDVADKRAELLSDRVYDAEIELMNLPAPDLQALRWKLDQILVQEDDSIPAWSYAFVRQTTADYRRLLEA